MVRIAAYWGYLVLGVGGTLLGPALTPLMAEFQVSPVGTGPLFLATSVGYLLAVVIGGPAGDHWNRGRVLFAGALFLGLGGVLVFTAPLWALVAVGLFALSLGAGVIDSGLNALMNETAPAGGHAREQSLLHTFFGVGALIGPLLIGAFLALGAGWRSAYAVDAVGAVMLAVLFTRLRVPGRAPGARAISARSVVTLAMTPYVLVLAVMSGAYIGAELLVGAWAATYLQDIHHFDTIAAATSVSLFWGGLAAGRLLSALATRWFSARLLLVMTCAFSLLACVGLVVAPNAPVALLALALCGLGYAAIFPLLMAVAGEVYPDAAGSIAGLLIGAGAVFGAILPWIGGVLVQYSDARAALAVSIPAGVVMLAVAAGLLFGDKVLDLLLFGHARDVVDELLDS